MLAILVSNRVSLLHSGVKSGTCMCFGRSYFIVIDKTVTNLHFAVHSTAYSNLCLLFSLPLPLTVENAACRP